MREIVLDTETTGLSFELGDRIIEVGCVELYNHIPSGKTLQFYCNVQKKISEEASKIHGITNERMRDEGVDISGVLQEFTSDWMKCQVIIANNLVFDSKVMQTEYMRNQPINWLGRHRKIEYCTMKYGKKFAKNLTGNLYLQFNYTFRTIIFAIIFAPF